ncbi:hypothetical protein ACTXT7_003343 [Hymenolepis weldensis]
MAEDAFYWLVEDAQTRHQSANHLSAAFDLVTLLVKAFTWHQQAHVVGGSGAALFGANKYYFSGGKCYETGRLDGKLVIVTGANTGIGKETAAELARRGANVIMACRNIEQAEAAKSDILTLYGKGQPTALTKNVNAKVKDSLTPIEPEQLIIEKLDLCSMKSIREFTDRISEKNLNIDILINNAGIMACPYAETEDGFESQIGTNHLGPFLLTELLLPAIKQAGEGARIIFVSSRAHYGTKTNLIPLNVKKENYSRIECYNRSKLANAMYAHYLGKTLAPLGILTASVHPGVVQTNLFRFLGIFSNLTEIRVVMMATQKLSSIGACHALFIPNVLTRPFMKTPWEGAQTILHTVLTPNLTSGAYYSDCVETKALPIVYDQIAGEELANASRAAVGMA